MRALVTIFAPLALAAAPMTPAVAASSTDATVHATAAGVTLTAPGLRAAIRGAPPATADRTELDVTVDGVHARLFRNTGVLPDFSQGRARVGRGFRSPYLGALGTGDGVSTGYRSSRYSITGSYLAGADSQAFAGEFGMFDGALAIQAGRKAVAEGAGSTSFAGARVDFDMLNAALSVGWHVGLEEDEDRRRETSAGGVAVGLSSVAGDGDRLRIALTRPIRRDLAFDAPELAFDYLLPVPVGRLTCSGGVQTGGGQASRVRVSWAMQW